MIRLSYLLILISFSFPVFSGNSSERIKGVADFLIDRANENYFYIFEHAIGKNQSLKCYFPDTYDHAQSGNLRALLQTKDVWRETIQSDLQSIITTSVSRPFAEVLESSDDIRNYYINLLQVLAIEVDGKPHSLDAIPINASVETREKINQFSLNMSAALDGFDLIRSELEAFSEPCYRSRWDLETTKAKIDQFKTAIGHANTQLDLLKENRSRLKLNREKLQSFCTSNNSLLCQSNGDIENLISPRRAGRSIGNSSDIEHAIEDAKSSFEKDLVNRLQRINLLLKHVDSYLFDIKSKETITGKSISALRLIEQSGLKPEKIEKLRRHVLFFAQVADADTATEVKALLSAYTLPAVSFFVKREPGESHWLISAWLGAGITEVTSGEERTDSSIYTPLGLEYSWGLQDRSSISVMLAPFDFGYPVSLKLNGLDDDVEFDEIVAPSLALAYGFKNYPLSTGIAYQKGRRIEDRDSAEDGIVLFLVFDMPLWTLH